MKLSKTRIIMCALFFGLVALVRYAIRDINLDVDLLRDSLMNMPALIMENIQMSREISGDIWRVKIPYLDREGSIVHMKSLDIRRQISPDKREWYFFGREGIYSHDIKAASINGLLGTLQEKSRTWNLESSKLNWQDGKDSLVFPEGLLIYDEEFMGKTTRALIVILMIFCSFSTKIHAADFEDYYENNYNDYDENPSEKVTLNADRVSFNDETGQAYAQGKAILTYQDTTIMAERIEYDADTQKVQAMPLPGEQVVLTNGNRSIKGDILNYDLNNKEGILTGAVTRLSVGEEGVLYVYGSEIDVMTWELAQERGLVKGSAEDYMLQWRDVVLTTCALDHPHYRLESKTITFIPNRSITAKKPRVYLGNTYLFTSPLDYVVQLKRRAVQYSFLPYIQHSETKGTGGGITGTIGWETGAASIGISYAGKAGFEFMFEVEQELNDDFSILAGVEHSWDDEWDERVWRPYASLIYSHKGWDARINWSRNEYITDQKDSTSEFKGRLDRRPEFIVWAPWFKSSVYSWMRLYASYGSFKETLHGNPNSEVTARYGMGFRNYFEYMLGEVELFSNSEGLAWFYDREDKDHEMFRSFTGLRYKIGAFQLGTGYERQYVWGESPMHWDSYHKRERIHQKIRFPLGREIYASLRGSYDLDESMIDEMIYSFQWITDCMTWDLHYKNDRTSGGDDQIGLSLSLNAFPDRQTSFGQKTDVDPFLRPKDVPEDKKEKRLF